MKIFGRWGRCWYRKRFKELDENERTLRRLKYKMTLLTIHSSVTENYATMVKKNCEVHIARIQMLREYLKERQER